MWGSCDTLTGKIICLYAHSQSATQPVSPFLAGELSGVCGGVGVSEWHGESQDGRVVTNDGYVLDGGSGHVGVSRAD